MMVMASFNANALSDGLASLRSSPRKLKVHGCGIDLFVSSEFIT